MRAISKERSSCWCSSSASSAISMLKLSAAASSSWSGTGQGQGEGGKRANMGRGFAREVQLEKYHITDNSSVSTYYHLLILTFTSMIQKTIAKRKTRITHSTLLLYIDLPIAATRAW